MIHDPASQKLPESLASAPAPVPVFNCVVYLASLPGGTVRARVANLAGLECEGQNERAVLQAIVAAFKRRVAELLTNGAEIAWIEPPQAADADERVRLIGVHL